MKIRCIASTEVGYEMEKEEALSFGGKAAGVCYMSGDIGDILFEEEEKTKRRISLTLNFGHHSVYEHAHFTLYLEGIPKILAMILNNEREYVTSEKSARYTKMKVEGKEKELYQKWIERLKERIKSTYPKMDDTKVNKLAMENARYFISVFTPATNMMYTTNLRQMNYILHWCKDYIKNEEETAFTSKLKEVLKEFVEQMDFLYIPELKSEPKPRALSLFDKRKKHREQWGEVYCTTYLGSFAQLAQAHRHRSIAYTMSIPEKVDFYIPEIIQAGRENVEWLEDMKSIAESYPQGMLVNICEMGTYEKFIEKSYERLCGQAQHEIMLQTLSTLKKYLTGVEQTDPEIYSELKEYDVGTRCNFGYKCDLPCFFGKKAIYRLV